MSINGFDWIETHDGSLLPLSKVDDFSVYQFGEQEQQFPAPAAFGDWMIVAIITGGYMAVINIPPVASKANAYESMARLRHSLSAEVGTMGNHVLTFIQWNGTESLTDNLEAWEVERFASGFYSRPVVAPTSDESE